MRHFREETIRCVCGWRGHGYGGDPCPRCGSTERAPTPRYVAQPNGYGCAIACVAMIVGKTYDEMEAWFMGQGLARERMERGIYDVLYFEALDRHGFSYVNRFIGCPFLNTREPREGWPPAPFAQIHICCADIAAGSHAVVMLADGSVLDPFKRERTSLAHHDYQEITQVVGIWRRS